MSVKLPRLPTNWQAQPQLLERYWDLTMTQIEGILTQLLELPIIKQAIEDAQAAADAAASDAANAQLTATVAQSTANTALSDAATAQATADAANTAASGAGTDATASLTEQSIVNSYPSGGSPLIESDSLGSITIDAHNRVYGNPSINPTVSVFGDTFSTTAVAGDIVRIYYDDPSRSGGSVTYQYTIDPAAPPVQSGSRHSVGAVVIPTTGTTSGIPLGPPGYVPTS